MTGSQTSMHAESSMNFGTSRLSGNGLIALPLKSREVAKCVISAVSPVRSPAICAMRPATVFGSDLFPRMLEQARQLNPDISFREGNMMSLDLPDDALGGITAFYAIVNSPNALLSSVFREMQRVLQPGGLLLLAFHIGDEVLHENELWGRPISMDFFLFQPSAIRDFAEAAGFAIEEIIERDPHAPEVEYQSRRAYIFARKTDP